MAVEADIDAAQWIEPKFGPGVAAVASAAASQPGVLWMRLFGSRARGDALNRLEEALAVPADAPLALDGTIQRFELTFELFWKAT